MLRIENVREVDQNGKAVLDFQCSTMADLPTLNQLVPGSSRYVTAAGSIAQVIQTGAWYTLDANGSWYFSGGVQPEEGD
jgi:hypothetical protein